VVGQNVAVELVGRAAATTETVAAYGKNVLIELQFERPAEVHHGIVALVDADDLTRLFSLPASEDEGEILAAESLLSLGDIISTFLDTLVADVTWLQPTPRAWLANLEPIVADASGALQVQVPALIAAESELYLADLSITTADGAACTLGILLGANAERALLGLDGAAPDTVVEEVAEPFLPPEPAPMPAMASTPAPEAPPSPPVQPVQFKPLGPEPSGGKSSGIDLIKDVPLHVSVELGRASLTVREILALGVGSVVELDRLAGEPVDVLVNDRLIARGEVVIVDESFGVRITEVLREASKRAAQ
jgi:flagellar motor switch protein FliN